MDIKENFITYYALYEDDRRSFTESFENNYGTDDHYESVGIYDGSSGKPIGKLPLIIAAIILVSGAYALGRSHSESSNGKGITNEYPSVILTSSDSSDSYSLLANTDLTLISSNYSSSYSSSTQTDQSAYSSSDQRKLPHALSDPVFVSSGGGHTAAITKDGSLYTWGDNEYGQLGYEEEFRSETPTKIMDDVVSVSLGYEHSAALKKDGSLYTWGCNIEGQLGIGTSDRDSYSTPTKIMDNVACVSLGWYHAAAITNDGSLYTWGINKEGEIGIGTTDEDPHPTPTKILDNMSSVSLGARFSAAISNDGSLYTWGSNWDYQLGNRMSVRGFPSIIAASK